MLGLANIPIEVFLSKAYFTISVATALVQCSFNSSSDDEMKPQANLNLRTNREWV